jgi:hypothetical protein
LTSGAKWCNLHQDEEDDMTTCDECGKDTHGDYCPHCEAKHYLDTYGHLPVSQRPERGDHR